jgi:hypothetical protein
MATPSMPGMSDQSAGSPPQGPGAGAPPSPQGGPQPPQGGPQQGPPSQGPANQIQQFLGNWSQVATQVGQAYPQIASQMNKIVQAIGEAQTAMVTPSQPTPTSQQPQY